MKKKNIKKSATIESSKLASPFLHYLLHIFFPLILFIQFCQVFASLDSINENPYRTLYALIFIAISLFSYGSLSSKIKSEIKNKKCIIRFKELEKENNLLKVKNDLLIEQGKGNGS